MNLEKNWPFLVYFLSITLLGFLGNSFGVASTCHKKMKTIGPVHIFTFLFVFGFLSLIIHSEYFFLKFTNFDLKVTTQSVCKLYYYASFLCNSIVTMMHVYITLERFLSMKYPVESNFLRKRSIQFGFILASIVLSAIFYLPNYIHHDIVTIKRIDGDHVYNKTLCTFATPQSKPVVLFLAFVNSIFLPIFLVIVFSIFLILKINSVRGRVYLLYTPREIALFKKDLKLAVLSIVLNSLTIVLTLPVILVVFIFKYSSEKYFYAYNLFYLANVIKFYLYFGAYLIFRTKKKTNTNRNRNQTRNLNCESLL